jgi:hypothetical protein
MRHRTTLIPPVLLIVLCTTLALAQTSPAPPKPGPEAEKLSAYVGEWAIHGNLPAGVMVNKGGKATGAASCNWVAERFGVFCRETLPGESSLSDVYLMAYDGEAKNYFFTQVSTAGVIWTGRGTVNGDTWVWIVDTTYNGKPIHFRFTEKWTSPDSYDFKNEVGVSADSMKVMMDGKETRTKTSNSKPAEEK